MQSSQVSNINIQCDNVSQVRAFSTAIFTLKGQPVGRSLINEIEQLGREGKKITVNIDKKSGCFAKAKLTEDQARVLNIPDDVSNEENHLQSYFFSTKSFDGINSLGTSVYVNWNPLESSQVDDDGKIIKDKNANSNFITLCHELIHAYHIMNGAALVDSIDEQYLTGESTRNEEQSVIGLGRFEHERFTENKIRAEHGLKLRRQ